jgi:3-oxoacyl-[acyl-carrier-protein] synthase-1
MRVFVVGTGVVSALGTGVESNFRCLLDMRHGLAADSSYIDPATSFPVGAVGLSNDELTDVLSVKMRLPRTSLFSLLALRECLLEYPFAGRCGCRFGLFSGTTVGGLDASEHFFAEYVPGGDGAKVSDIVHHTCGSATNVLLPYLPHVSAVSTLTTACSSAANAIVLAAMKIRCGRLDVAAAGGSDALCRFTLNGFASLMILDRELCKPMDAGRDGLNLGEGAGYLLLASESYVEDNGMTPLCELVAYANANDAFHATALSDEGDGPRLAMERTLERAGAAPDEIDYINLHGTGTPNNDLAESAAIRSIFGERPPVLSSTKSFTGHALGASGGMEAVFSTLAIREQTVFANLNFSRPMPDGFVPVLRSEKARIRRVLSNSFGFGGNCTCLMFQKV